jgi:Family of unknown function (DUF5996)
MFSPIFRRSFLGESSPVHSFWGTFDLAVTRLSGRRVPQASATVNEIRLAIEQWPSPAQRNAMIELRIVLAWGLGEYEWNPR